RDREETDGGASARVLRMLRAESEEPSDADRERREPEEADPLGPQQGSSGGDDDAHEHDRAEAEVLAEQHGAKALLLRAEDDQQEQIVDVRGDEREKRGNEAR